LQKLDKLRSICCDFLNKKLPCYSGFCNLLAYAIELQSYFQKFIDEIIVGIGGKYYLSDKTINLLLLLPHKIRIKQLRLTRGGTVSNISTQHLLLNGYVQREFQVIKTMLRKDLQKSNYILLMFIFWRFCSHNVKWFGNLTK